MRCNSYTMVQVRGSLRFALLAVFALSNIAFAREQEQPSTEGQSSGQPEYQTDVGVQSICDKYTISLFGENTLANQALLMTIFVNTGMVGNYTTPNIGISVPGVIWPSVWQGQPINQMPYFNGELASSNLEVDLGHGVAVNWLDGGGPEALRQNLAAFDQSSNQL